MEELPSYFKIFSDDKDLDISIETSKISDKIVRSFYKFSRKSGGKQKKWPLFWNGHQIFEKNIQNLKLAERAQFQIDFQNML